MKDKLRVLQLVATGSAGGAERIVLSLSKELSYRDHKAMVACPPGWLRESLDRQGISSVEMKMARLHAVRATICAATYVRKNGVDLLHCHLSRAAKIGYATHILTGKPVVTTAHTLVGHPIYHRLANRSQRLVAVSHRVEELLLREGVRREAIDVIHNGTDFASQPAQGAGVLNSFGIPPEAKVIGFVGRLTRIKGAMDLLEAFVEIAERHTNVYLLVIGPIFENIKGECDAVIDRYGLGSRIILTGPVQDVAPLIDRMDIVAIPSHKEAFGLSAIEAMARGKPVVAYNIGGLAETVEHGVNGLIVPNNPGDLANGIESLVIDSATGVRMGLEGARTVSERFTLSRMVDRYEAVYQGALQGSRIDGRSEVRKSLELGS